MDENTALTNDGKRSSWIKRHTRAFLKLDWSVVRLFIVLLTPILVTLVFIIDTGQEVRCAYILLVTATFWTTEALPLGITGLIPVVLFPLFGVIPTSIITLNYMKDAIMLILGSYAIAIAIEKWDLHKRVALGTVLKIGFTVPRLLIGFMLPTMFLSMWIANTAACTMMVPIVDSVLQVLKKHKLQANEGDTGSATETVFPCPSTETEAGPSTETEETDSLPQMDLYQIDTGSATGTVLPCPSTETEAGPSTEMEAGPSKETEAGPSTEMEDGDRAMAEYEYECICKAMFLGVAYSATCGGCATLIGTPPNLILQTEADSFFAQFGLTSGITFANWIIFALPMVLICVFLCWLWLLIHWIGFRKTFSGFCGSNADKDTENNDAVEAVLREELDSLGPLTFAEKSTIAHIAVVVILWLTLDPGVAPGWGELFKDGYISSALPAILVTILLFIWPSKSRCESLANGSEWVYEPLMDIDTMMVKIPWHLLLLVGGGLAIAHGCEDSGLGAWAGSKLSGLGDLSPWVLTGIIATIVAFATEFISNTAIIAILMPVLSRMAIAISVHPLLLAIPGGIACSFAFMLPVATIPNAIVFSYGHLTLMDMAKSGLMMNIICIFVVTLATNTWGVWVFGYNVIPEEILQAQNSTVI